MLFVLEQKTFICISLSKFIIRKYDNFNETMNIHLSRKLKAYYEVVAIIVFSTINQIFRQSSVAERWITGYIWSIYLYKYSFQSFYFLYVTILCLLPHWQITQNVFIYYFPVSLKIKDRFWKIIILWWHCICMIHKFRTHIDSY